MNLGFCYEAIGAKDEAISAYNLAIEIDPDHEFAVSYLYE